MNATNDLPYGIAPPGHRLPAETRLGRVKLQVADLGRSLEFYTRVLGLVVVDESTHHASLAAQGSVGAGRARGGESGNGRDSGSAEPLVELRELRGARTVPRRGQLGLFHFAILLPDRPSLGRFLAHLTERRIPAGMSDHLVSEALYLQDPDNLGIEVYADRPRASWAQDGRQLVMATEPLDAEDLMNSTAGARWTGMPAGTRMGHVHLHVGDLEGAEKFYHEALGFDKVVWSYPGALFLSAGGYHHHLGTNTWARGAPPATDSDARLLEWRIVLPDAADVARAADSIVRGGHRIERDGSEVVARDPWGTQLRLCVRNGTDIAL